MAYQFAGPLAFVAYVPLLFVLAQRANDLRRWSVIGLVYLCTFLYHAGTNWWICSWQERTDPFLFASGIALAVVHPMFLSVPFVVLASIRRRLGYRWMLLIAPLAITGFEWLHGQTDASYPWLTSGYMLVHTPWGQLAELVGVYGLTFLIAVVNAVLALWFIEGKAVRTARAMLASVVGALIVLALLGLWLESRAGQNDTRAAAHTVVIIQPNEDPWDKWTDARMQVAVLRSITDSVRATGVPPHALYVWPETAIPYSIRRPVYASDFAEFNKWVDTSMINLLTGYADWYDYPIGTAPPSARQYASNEAGRYDVFNAAMLLRHNSNPFSPIAVHRKTRLTPFAERLPFADQLTFAMSWIEWGVGISAWGKGSTFSPLELDSSARIGVIICIESIYPEVSRTLVANGATMLSVITNDAWYNGTWGPQQHFDIARMRAIETRRTIIRCANSGISGVILPSGESVATDLRPMMKGAMVASVQPRRDVTLYVRFGDVLPPVALILTLIAVISARFQFVIRNMRPVFDQDLQDMT